MWFQCYLPAGVPGPDSFYITTTVGNRASAAFTFTYNDPVINTLTPSVAASIPIAGQVGAGLLTISGTNFGKSGTVLWDSNQLLTANVVSWYSMMHTNHDHVLYTAVCTHCYLCVFVVA